MEYTATYPKRYTIPYLKKRTIEKNGCWEWTGKTCNGYATVAYQVLGIVKYKRVHRMTYEILKGDIPKGLVLDHLCNNPVCINPNHLVPTTISENAARGGSRSGINRVKTHCHRGHEFAEANTYLNKITGSRRCRECRRSFWK